MALSSLYNDERYGDAMSLENVVQNGELLDCYGELLTPRQRECLDLYYNENLTLAEIAEYFHISRQAVHDAMRHGEEQLRRMSPPFIWRRQGSGGRKRPNRWRV